MAMGFATVTLVVNVQTMDDRTCDDTSSNIVATHYNTIQEKGLEFRNTSRILYLRNFNNWVKSMLLDEFIGKIRETLPKGNPLKALDICCGKGGDLLKWKLGNVNHVIFADIAALSIEDCKRRYEESKRKTAGMFTAEFITADVTKINLREKYLDKKIQLDLVSCQFAFHYCFETYQQAQMMLKNVSECLKPGGYFIGTIPNAFEIIGRQKNSRCNTFGNEIFSISFTPEVARTYPLFGGKYNFQLEGVVDCPEYLVHFPTFERLAERYGLKCVKRKRFQNYFDEMRKKGLVLLSKMSALETYPPLPSVKLVGHKYDYKHARDYMKEYYGNKHIGTLTLQEWEVASLYMIFAFQKQK